MSETKHVKILWPDFIEDVKHFDEMSMAIVNQRQGDVYDDSWAIMSLESILDAAKYKCDRARYTFKAEKKLDDVMDAYNYLRYAGIRIMAELNAKRQEQKKHAEKTP